MAYPGELTLLLIPTPDVWICGCILLVFIATLRCKFSEKITTSLTFNTRLNAIIEVKTIEMTSITVLSAIRTALVNQNYLVWLSEGQLEVCTPDAMETRFLINPATYEVSPKNREIEKIIDCVVTAHKQLNRSITTKRESK